MKMLGITLWLIGLIFVDFGTVQAQKGREANEDAAKRTEAMRQRVAKFGTGERAKVKVELLIKRNTPAT